MHDLVGYAFEKLGRAVNKVMLLRNVGEIEVEREVQMSVKGVVSLVKKSVKLVKWRVVAQHYFLPKEQFWEFGNKAYELKLEHETYGRGEVHVQFLNFETGDALNMNGCVLASEKPEYLKRLVNTQHIKDFVMQNKQQVAWVFIVIGLAAGIAVGFVLGQNIHLAPAAPAVSAAPVVRLVLSLLGS